MFSKILVALDGSDPSWRALRTAIELAQAHHSTLIAVGVEEHLPHYAATVGETEETKDQLDAYFSQVMDGARRLAVEQGVTLESTIRAGDAAHQILLAAQDIGADLIVLGPRGHSVIRDFLLGTTTDRVTHHSPCSVLVVR